MIMKCEELNWLCKHIKRWVKECVYFAITTNDIMLSAVYDYNILLPGI